MTRPEDQPTSGEPWVGRGRFEAMQGCQAGRREAGIGGAGGEHGLCGVTEAQMAYIQGR